MIKAYEAARNDILVISDSSIKSKLSRTYILKLWNLEQQWKRCLCLSVMLDRSHVHVHLHPYSFLLAHGEEYNIMW